MLPIPAHLDGICPLASGACNEDCGHHLDARRCRLPSPPRWSRLVVPSASRAARGHRRIRVARRSIEWTTVVVVAFGFVMPAFLLLVGIGFRFWYLSVWMAALVGAMAAGSPATVWRYPPRLRFPLVAWALAVGLSWPLVAIRVLDWNPLLPWLPAAAPSDAANAIRSAVWVQSRRVGAPPRSPLDRLAVRAIRGRHRRIDSSAPSFVRSLCRRRWPRRLPYIRVSPT